MPKNQERARKNRANRRKKRIKKRLNKLSDGLGFSAERAENLFKEHWARLQLDDPE